MTLLIRVLPAGVVGLVCLTLATLWLTGARQPYMIFLDALGLHPFYFPFLDIHAVLAAIECHRLGVDVYTLNPCDALGRLHVYSPLWLHLGFLPITTAWTGPTGLALDVLFICGLATLPSARRPTGILVTVIASASPAVLFALERANNDLLIFLLALLTGHLVMRSRRLASCGYAAVVLAGALKFYPAALLILAWREQWQRCLIIIAVSLIALAACFLPELESLRRVLHLLPNGAADSFGATNVPSAFVHSVHWPTWTRLPIQGVLMVLMALKAQQWSRRLRPGLTRLSESQRVFLTVGATLIVACFLTGQNAGYRAIHLLFALPALLALAGDGDDYLIRTVMALVLPVMWSIGLPFDQNYFCRLLWMADQYSWWFIVTVLSALLLAIWQDSVAMNTLARRFRGRPQQNGV